MGGFGVIVNMAAGCRDTIRSDYLMLDSTFRPLRCLPTERRKAASWERT